MQVGLGDQLTQCPSITLPIHVHSRIHHDILSHIMMRYRYIARCRCWVQSSWAVKYVELMTWRFDFFYMCPWRFSSQHPDVTSCCSSGEQRPQPELTASVRHRARLNTCPNQPQVCIGLKTHCVSGITGYTVTELLAWWSLSPTSRTGCLSHDMAELYLSQNISCLCCSLVDSQSSELLSLLLTAVAFIFSGSMWIYFRSAVCHLCGLLYDCPCSKSFWVCQQICYAKNKTESMRNRGKEGQRIP